MNSIMYVDDDEDDRQLFHEVVKSIKPNIVYCEARDGVHALELLNEMVVFPDCIFLDMNMPRLSGTEFLIELRKSKYLKNIAVIMYSTSRTESDVELCRKLGVMDYIVKPSSLLGLQHELNKLLQPSTTA